jgi:hypothetical protein
MHQELGFVSVIKDGLQTLARLSADSRVITDGSDKMPLDRDIHVP